MSTVVNGHREGEGGRRGVGGAGPSSGSGRIPPSRGRPPHGHILPTLSFSASTPTEDEDPLDHDPVLAIDSPLWEQPEVEVVVHEPTPHHHQNHDPSPPHPRPSFREEEEEEEGNENTPLLSSERGASIMTSVECNHAEEEASERVPLLSGCFSGGASATGLTLPLNLSRSAQDGVEECEGQEGLREVAGRLVKEVLQRAKEQAALSRKVSADERLMEVVRGFVNEILIHAKAEAYDSMCHVQNNNNNLMAGKEDTAASGHIPSSTDASHSLASPSESRPYRRGGPWYVQMGRVFSSFLSRICPCRCPTKP
ncbi:uncharacterized protein LOC126986366 isoform X2 [Eriocheir sinensis]|uniref:uncharacterized protein LOC126986366 isoform X2 n=1 Tax=Eriocheir sinensis TaxID=95602 RepID=UPI0021C8189A|nr:uncharacterized protein LOC126986366 isoform X2 [Eriocheir sinensis]